MYNIIRTQKAAIFCAIAAVCCPLSNAQELAQNVSVNVTIYPEGGFMNGGWGNVNFNFTNDSDEKVAVKKLEAEWKVKGEGYSKWGQGSNVTLEPSGKGQQSVTTYMPGQSEDFAKSKGGTPYIEGNAILDNGKVVPFKVDVPVAVLPTPIKAVTGKYMSVDLQESTWAQINDPAKVLKYLDAVYASMQELTSNTPFDGKTSVILECPPNPYFAYAGNPIVLNGSFAATSAKRLDNDLIDFGWVHEMGHNFDDVIGHWYNYGTFTEFQANIKLSYVIEQLCVDGSTIKMHANMNSGDPVNGKVFNDSYFPPYGEEYLASGKPATEMRSDDYHALFFIVIREKGWDVMKKYYKTYVDLSATGAEPPSGYERVLLTLAVLDHVSGMDLAPLYKDWRIQLDREALDALIKKYNVK